MRAFARLLMLALLALYCVKGVASAQDSDLPVLLSADEMTYDQQLDIAVAKGHVELSYGDRILLADSLTYNQAQDFVTASGNVSLVEDDGNVLFADYVELSGDLRRGAIKSIRMLLADRSRLAANGARRYGNGITELSKAVYSPCDLCADDPSRAPLWQIKAVKVVHDQNDKEIAYVDALFEVFGVPVAWLPYFSHPDPSVKRKTGFLGPVFGSSSFLGSSVQVPFFFNIAPNRDATFAPIFSTEEGVILTGEYRQATQRGELTFRASATHSPRERIDQDVSSRVRGHVELHARQDLSEKWTLGADAERASDATYLSQYGFRRGENTLTSHAFAERFDEGSYTEISGFAFQSLDPLENPDTIPLVTPFASYNWIGEPTTLGGRLTFDANAMVLTRDFGADSKRLSITGGWVRTLESTWGSRLTINASVRGDVYDVADVIDPNLPNGPRLEGTTGRFVPQVVLDWRHPLVRHDGRYSEVIEPIVQFIASPNNKNPDEIPNEDSVDLELDDTNLFSANRFPGLDRVETGVRVNYGLKTSIYGADGPLASVLLGQSYREESNNIFENGSGLTGHFSDYVGRIDLYLLPFVDLSYRTRLDSDDFSVQRTALRAALNYWRFQLSTDYISISDTPTTATPQNIEEVFVYGRFDVTDHWAVSGRLRRDLNSGGGTLLTGASVIYHDECVQIIGRFQRDFFRDVGLEPSTSFILQLQLANLG
ncbi:MAG: organic solvent tolerance protein [Rhodospirillaceae bacterium]|nr:organic solvent tolerance protein [Rhodospirillaceae bacterium]